MFSEAFCSADNNSSAGNDNMPQPVMEILSVCQTLIRKCVVVFTSKSLLL